MVESPDSRLDRAGIIHVAYADGQNGNVYYQTFSTLTDVWGLRIVIGTGARVTDGSSWPRSGQVALSLDANESRMSCMQRQESPILRYTSGSAEGWSSPVTVASGPT